MRAAVLRTLSRHSSAALTLCMAFCLVPARVSAVEEYRVADYATPQAAIDAAKAPFKGGIVRFPCGTTVIAGTLVVDGPSPVTLEGCGPQGTVLQASFANADIVEIGKRAQPFAPCGGARDLSFTSSVARVPGVYAVTVDGCEDGNFENLRIATNGGGGVRFLLGPRSPSGARPGLAAIGFARAIEIELKGGATGIELDGNNDRNFEQIFIRGDGSAGSRGIRIRSSGGDFFKDVQVVQCEIGVDVAPDPGQGTFWSHFDNVNADSNGVAGFRYAGAGGIRGISCARCGASGNAGVGFLIEKGIGLSLVDSRALDNGTHGVVVTAGASDVEISGGIYAGNCAAPSCVGGQAHGIFVNASGVRIQGVRSGPTAGRTTPPIKQGNGIQIGSGSDHFVIKGNDTRGNAVAGIQNSAGVGPTRIVQDNL